MQSPLNILTVEEYLEAEKSSDIRHEYVAHIPHPELSHIKKA